MSARRTTVLALLFATTLAACGGGAGDAPVTGGPPDAGTPPPPPAPPPPAPPPPPPPPAAPGPWSAATVGGGGAALYGCDTGAAFEGFASYRYVRAGASGGDGSRARPFGTLQAAYATIGSGQKVTLCVEEGAYVENVGSSVDDLARGVRLVGAFAAGSDYTRRALAGPLSAVVAATSTLPVLRLGNHGEIVVDGFDLSGGLRGLHVQGYAAGRRLVVRNNIVHHNGVRIGSAADLPAGVDPNSVGGVVASGSQVVIEYNEIHDNQGAHNGAGLNLGGAASSEENRWSGGTLQIGSALALVRYNRIHHNVLRWDTPHGAGVTLNVNTRFERNLVWANEALKWAGAGGDGVGGGLIAQSPQATVRIADNWFEGNRALKAGAAFFADEASIATAYDNVVVGNLGDSAIAVDGRAAGNGATDRSCLTLVHNTVALNTGAALLVQDSTLHAFDNLFWHNAAAADLQLAAGGSLAELVRAEHNVMKGSYGGIAGVNVGVQVDLEASQPFVAPQLVPTGGLSVTSADLRPAAAAGPPVLWTFEPACAHAGALVEPPAFDAAGVARRADGSLNVGAYQRVGAGLAAP